VERVLVSSCLLCREIVAAKDAAGVSVGCPEVAISSHKVCCNATGRSVPWISAVASERSPMPERERETDQHRMLLLVESAQRAGLSEREIVEIVEDAIKADAEHERAA
jgi:hypothetical protein